MARKHTPNIEYIVNTNVDGDTFVGISCEKGGDVKISFPLGFRLSSDETGNRKDAALLIRTLSRNVDKRKSELQIEVRKFSDEVSFPIQACMYLVRDFMDRGYYKETEIRHVKSRRGKINWSRTIKTQKAYIQNGNAYYLDFMTEKKQCDSDELITLIHEYCVHESYEKIGWLFSSGRGSKIPRMPRIRFQKKLFLSVLRGKLDSTFNDRNRKLFQAMWAMVSWLGDSDSDVRFYYGTYRFEYVWEKMIDRVYGIKNKNEYFPKTRWTIDGWGVHENASLEPDTIMKIMMLGDDIYVLDSKYYRYGVTRNPGDLPESSSINKQITYGEYIYNEYAAKQRDGEGGEVYNAFILPYDAKDGESSSMDDDTYLRKIGYATGDWKEQNEGSKKYEKVWGILLDVRHLMESDGESDLKEKEKISEIIRSGQT